MFDWNDLQYLLAVARRGSTLAAARELGVNQSTVHRRVAELERQLKLRLVHRHPTESELARCPVRHLQSLTMRQQLARPCS